MSACEKDKFDLVLGHGDEVEEEGEILLTFTINDRFYSEEEQVRTGFMLGKDLSKHDPH